MAGRTYRGPARYGYEQRTINPSSDLADLDIIAWSNTPGINKVRAVTNGRPLFCGLDIDQPNKDNLYLTFGSEN